MLKHVAIILLLDIIYVLVMCATCQKLGQRLQQFIQNILKYFCHTFMSVNLKHSNFFGVQPTPMTLVII